eukprot:6252110-Prymnesium_polylepis.1
MKTNQEANAYSASCPTHAPSRLVSRGNTPRTAERTHCTRRQLSHTHAASLSLACSLSRALTSSRACHRWHGILEHPHSQRATPRTPRCDLRGPGGGRGATPRVPPGPRHRVRAQQLLYRAVLAAGMRGKGAGVGCVAPIAAARPRFQPDDRIPPSVAQIFAPLPSWRVG